MPQNNPYLVSVAILFSGLVLAIATYIIRSGPQGPVAMTGDISLVLPVTAEDHILGSPTAKVAIIEYSDMDCEYCKKYQQVLEQIMTDYGTKGSVALVYRHFPVVSAHPNASEHAEAAECVSALSGPDAFWRFVDAIAARSPGASQFDPANYGSIATSLGVLPTALESCRAGDTHLARVSRDFQNALEIGAEGAPFTVVLINGANPISISGYIPYNNMKQVVETALSKATSTP